jgi:hypothetical protein
MGMEGYLSKCCRIHWTFEAAAMFWLLKTFQNNLVAGGAFVIYNFLEIKEVLNFDFSVL